MQSLVSKDDHLHNPKPHFVLVPFLAQGHMIPMVDMACTIAARGVLVSFITTPVNAARISLTIDRVKVDGLPIRFVEFDFPPKEAGLPAGLENLDLITSLDLYVPFFEALSSFEEPLKLYLKEQKPGPVCIISDNIMWWTMRVAEELNIQRFIFYGPSCFFSLCIHNIRKYKVYENLQEESELVVVPDLPQRITTSKAQTPFWFDQPGFQNFHENFIKSGDTADGVIVNTFKELEPVFLVLYENTLGQKIWPIGPLYLCNKDINSKATRGNKASVDKSHISDWLDSLEARSVVFVNFGSLVHTNASQITEIGCGLEATNRPFIWVIKEMERCSKIDEWMLGFEERTRERGLIITGWAPQIFILSHPSVGGFITHCGWNSVLEAVSTGVPMITCPHFGDQFLNEKLMVEVLKIGVSLGVSEPYIIRTEDKVRVKRDDVKRAIESLMGGEEEAVERRARAQVFGELARKAMEDGGSSCENLTRMIQFVVECAANKVL